MFRNATAYVVAVDCLPTPDVLAEAVEANPLRQPGPLELGTQGFVSPYGRGHDAGTHREGQNSLLTFSTCTRMLPAQVVNDAVAEKLDKLEAERGRRPGAKERMFIKDDVLNELMPRAFLKFSRTDAWLDHETGLFVIDSASRRTCDAIVHALREALGGFPAAPLSGGTTVGSASIAFTALLHDPLPDLEIGDEAILRDPCDDGAIVRCERQDLAADEILEHLNAGKLAEDLAITYDGRISFRIDTDLVLRKIRLTDVVTDSQEEMTDNDAVSVVSAEFLLTTGELRRLYSRLHTWLNLDFDTLHLDGGIAAKEAP